MLTDLSVDELMTDRQLQEFLDISRTTLWRLRKQAGLPYGKVGRSYRYRKSEILLWITENPGVSKQLTLNLKVPD
jgi:predicted DNA-binding transcriptional regulator AlpA